MAERNMLGCQGMLTPDLAGQTTTDNWTYDHELHLKDLACLQLGIT